MSLYDANGRINLTTVTGSAYTGLYAGDGSYNIVLNDGSVYQGLHNPCGAYNAVLISSLPANWYAPNGSMNVWYDGTTYHPLVPTGPSGTITPVSPFTGIRADSTIVTADRNSITADETTTVDSMRLTVDYVSLTADYSR